MHDGVTFCDDNENKAANGGGRMEPAAFCQFSGFVFLAMQDILCSTMFIAGSCKLALGTKCWFLSRHLSRWTKMTAASLGCYCSLLFRGYCTSLTRGEIYDQIVERYSLLPCFLWTKRFHHPSLHRRKHARTFFFVLG